MNRSLFIFVCLWFVGMCLDCLYIVWLFVVYFLVDQSSFLLPFLFYFPFLDGLGGWDTMRFQIYVIFNTTIPVSHPLAQINSMKTMKKQPGMGDKFIRSISNRFLQKKTEPRKEEGFEIASRFGTENDCGSTHHWHRHDTQYKVQSVHSFKCLHHENNCYITIRLD